MDAPKPSGYLTEHADLLLCAAKDGPTLDLACGSGQNGLYLAEKGVEVHFWDREEQGLDNIKSIARVKGLKVFIRQIDLETGQGGALPADYFSLIMVFRYLHRPLISDIKKAVLPGGIVIYETFTTRQAELGKPSNPDFLLKENELLEWFRDWEIIDHRQARLENPERYMAGVIARKPQAIVDSQLPYKHELLRKAVHIPALIIPAGMLMLERHQSIIILGFVTILAVSLDLLRARHTLLNRWIQKIFGLLMRPGEKAASEAGVVLNGATWALISAFLLILIFPVNVAAFSISVFLIGDAAAALAGRRFGRIKWGRGSKTMEGSLAFLLTALMVIPIIPGVKFWTGFLACLGACLAEALPGPVNDNLRVPLSAAGIMVFLEYVL